MLTGFDTNGKDNISLNNSWMPCYDSSLMRGVKDNLFAYDLSSIIQKKVADNFWPEGQASWKGRPLAQS